MRRSSREVRRVLGIMSGTSIDGVDYALCDVGDDAIRLVQLWRAEFPAKLRERLHAAAAGACSSHELGQLHHDLGRFYAAHAMGPKHKADLVGLHGQTVYHNPSRKSAATLQIGEPAWLAEALRVPVVSNFRAADLAAGGQGAPIATMFHKLVFAQPGRHVCVNNLGGISNISSIDWRHDREPKLAAFDTGPANVLMDLASRHFSGGRKRMDADGGWAARGKVHEGLLSRWLRHPFFEAAPPKSTGREMFGEAFLNSAIVEMKHAGLSRFDALATLTALTARSIACACERHLPSLPDRMILSGGGAANPVLKSSIAGALRSISKDIVTMTTAELGWPLQSIEPAAFALLAWLRVRRKPGNLPQTTGAKRPALLGQITEV
jgi:anhydro-N-acetylmuramic acid kinase